MPKLKNAHKKTRLKSASFLHQLKQIRTGLPWAGRFDFFLPLNYASGHMRYQLFILPRYC